MKPLLIPGPSGKGSARKKKKSVCLFSPSIVTLIIRNWRRCILVRVEFEVSPPPPSSLLSSPFIIGSLMEQRKTCWFFYETVMKMCTLHVKSIHFLNSDDHF